MDALPDHLSLLAHIRAFSGKKGLFARFLNLQVQVNWYDGVLLQILRRLKMLVGPDLGRLQCLEDLV